MTNRRRVSKSCSMKSSPTKLGRRSLWQSYHGVPILSESQYHDWSSFICIGVSIRIFWSIFGIGTCWAHADYSLLMCPTMSHHQLTPIFYIDSSIKVNSNAHRRMCQSIFLSIYFSLVGLIPSSTREHCLREKLDVPIGGYCAYQFHTSSHLAFYIHFYVAKATSLIIYNIKTI